MRNSQAHARDRSSRIYAVKEMSGNLRPFLETAAGFIFGNGENLSHLANIIRYRRIPACVSGELWNAAIGNDGIYAEFKSDHEVICTEEERKGYALAYESYCRELEAADMRIPVYDIAAKVLQPSGGRVHTKIGRKALSVNKLASLGYAVPRTMILGNFVPGVSKVDDDCIEAVFGYMNTSGSGQCGMIIRPSLYADPLSKRFVSGLVASGTATERDGLNKALVSVLEKWNRLNKAKERYPISVIIQEYVPAKAHGLLFTRVPWDYSSTGMVIRLTFHSAGADRNEQIIVDTPSGQKERPCGYLREKLLPVFATGSVDPEFLAGLTRFSEECLLLQNRLGIPLDIEFAVSRDNEFVFVQFRQAFIDI